MKETFNKIYDKNLFFYEKKKTKKTGSIDNISHECQFVCVFSLKTQLVFQSQSSVLR